MNKPDNDCPFSLDSEITRPVWKIDTFPKFQLRLDESGSVAVETTDSGKATVTGTGYGGYPVNDSTSFRVSGPVVVEEGQLKFQPGSR